MLLINPVKNGAKKLIELCNRHPKRRTASRGFFAFVPWIEKKNRKQKAARSKCAGNRAHIVKPPLRIKYAKAGVLKCPMKSPGKPFWKVKEISQFVSFLTGNGKLTRPLYCQWGNIEADHLGVRRRSCNRPDIMPVSAAWNKNVTV